MRKSMPAWALLLASALGPSAALAIEGGAPPIYPDGLKTTWSAPPCPAGRALPDLRRRAALRQLRRHSGESLVRDFKVNVNMLALRLIWVAPAGAGRQPALHTAVPLLDVDFRANGARFKSSGLGDIACRRGAITASPALLHYLFGVDVYAPTGKYDARIRPAWARTTDHPAPGRADSTRSPPA